MVSFCRSVAVMLIWAMLVSPVYAQTATTSTTTPSSSKSSSRGDNALGIGLGIGAGVLGLGLLSQLGAAAPIPKFTSFGGRVITVVPCASPLGPSIHIIIIPAGIFPIAYIWTPVTITYLYGPPRNPGQQVLGLADIPFTCVVGLVPLFGLRMTTVGTSPVF